MFPSAVCSALSAYPLIRGHVGGPRVAWWTRCSDSDSQGDSNDGFPAHADCRSARPLRLDGDPSSPIPRAGSTRSSTSSAKEPGEATVTLAQFDTEYEVVYANRPIADVPRLELQPRGGTALYDALGRLITDVGAELAAAARGRAARARDRGRHDRRARELEQRVDARGGQRGHQASGDASTPGTSSSSAPTWTRSRSAQQLGFAADQSMTYATSRRRCGVRDGVDQQPTCRASGRHPPAAAVAGFSDEDRAAAGAARRVTADTGARGRSASPSSTPPTDPSAASTTERSRRGREFATPRRPSGSCDGAPRSRRSGGPRSPTRPGSDRSARSPPTRGSRSTSAHPRATTA